MIATLDTALPVLERTPATLRALVGELPEAWLRATEGPRTWSPFDVVGHLIHAERVNWIPRMEHLLRHGTSEPFPTFDREAMFEASRGRTISELLTEFEALRAASLARLRAMAPGPDDLEKRGTHPEFGDVTLGQLLATWTVHDLTHISQIVRVMAHQYADAVGPWRAYLSVLEPR